ncbi:MAG: MoaD/ThiS family protein [Deltaproteobacteria bacterium]|nr:MAG: MoaD/ThiS family protein [Deltaproteobacteria bacterium]
MSIKVNIHQNLRHLTNDLSTVEVSGTTVGECLNDLVGQFPGLKKYVFDKKNRLLNYVDVYVNLESSFPEELAKPVKDGDELDITLIIAGG